MQDAVGDEYTIVGQYINYKTKIRLKHNKCGYEWDIRPDFFLKRHNRCPQCNRGSITKDAAQKQLDKKYPGMYTILEYRGRAAKRSLIQNNQCDHQYEMFLQHPKPCPICRHQNSLASKKKQIQQKLNSQIQSNLELNNIFNIVWDNSYSLAGTIQCKKCGHIQHSKRISATLLSRCYQCHPIHKAPKNTQEFIDKVKFYTDEYEILGEYINSNTPISVKHQCGNVFNIIPSAFIGRLKINKTPCIRCHPPTTARTTQQYQQELDQKYGKNCFIVLEEYINMQTPILVKHKCGFEYKVTPDQLLIDHSTKFCPNCFPAQHSEGERKIKEFLNQYKIKNITQYRIKDCKDKKPLPFDFAVFKTDGTLYKLIEFDGNQHTDIIRAWGGIENLKSVQKHDAIKTNYCKQHNISLLRIPYKYKNRLEDILKENLSELIKIA
jgi:predicted Zn-ribbon and HTH transcriptional regulator